MADLRDSVLRDELCCPICLDIFKDPVTLVCGHSFCSTCIKNVPRTSGKIMCPQCRKKFALRSIPTTNVNLKNIAEQFRTTEQVSIKCTYCDHPTDAEKTCLQCEISMCRRHLRYHNRSVQHNLIDPSTALESKKCPIHNKMRGYYCKVDATCICVTCYLSKEYRGLPVVPLNEACERKKRNLLELFWQMFAKTDFNKWKIQKLKEDIQKMQEKADLQENNSMDGTLSKKQQKLLNVTEQIKELENEVRERALKQTCIVELCNKNDPIAILEELVIGREDCSNTGRDTGTVHKSLPDITSKAKKWWFPKQRCTDLLLDMNTAANDIYVSDDLKAAAYSEIIQAYPKKEDRFEHHQVLSINRFSAGRHYWDVDSRQSENWMIGVCYASIDKTGKNSFMGCNTKSWCLRRRQNEFWMQHNNSCAYLPGMTSCSHIRVSLDYNAGHLSFHDLACPIRHIQTYIVIFTEPLQAGFTIFNGCLQISTPEETEPIELSDEDSGDFTD
ncbi:E3 ubiquitin/ISG15 ligase TRIM25-like [Leptodactylus fuscus]